MLTSTLVSCLVYLRKLTNIRVSSTLNCFQNNRQNLPSLESLYQQRLLGRASLISRDSSHPAHDLFDPLPSSRRFRSFKTRTNKFSSSFPPPSRTNPVKTEVILFPIYSTHIFYLSMCFSVYYHNLLYIILFYILHFLILILILDLINYYLSML